METCTIPDDISKTKKDNVFGLNEQTTLNVALRTYSTDKYALEYTPKQMLYAACHLNNNPTLALHQYTHPILLSRISMNSVVGLYRTRNMNVRLMKFQLSSSSDKIYLDALVNKRLYESIQHIDPNKTSISSIHTVAPVLIEVYDSNTFVMLDKYKMYTNANVNHYFDKGYIPTGNENVVPCIITDVVGNATSLKNVVSLATMTKMFLGCFKEPLQGDEIGKFFETVYDNTKTYQTIGDVVTVYKTMLSELDQLLHTLVLVSAKHRFIHNDLHMGNILYDKTKMKFTLIDFGRSYIELERDMIMETLSTILPNKLRNKSSQPWNIDTIESLFGRIASSSDANSELWKVNVNDSYCIIPNDMYCPFMNDLATISYTMYKLMAYIPVMQHIVTPLSDILLLSTRESYIRIPSDRSKIAAMGITLSKTDATYVFMVRGITWLALYLWTHIHANTIDSDKVVIRLPYIYISTSIIFESSGDPQQQKLNRNKAIIHGNGIFYKEPYTKVCHLFAAVVKDLIPRYTNMDGGKRKKRQKGGNTRPTVAAPIVSNEKDQLFQTYYANMLMESKAMSIQENELPTGWDDIPTHQINGPIPNIPDVVTRMMQQEVKTSPIQVNNVHVVAHGGKKSKM
jgi:hypothetical protein